MTGNLRSWIHYIQERKSTQRGVLLEHTLIAQEILKEMKKHFPLIFSLIDEEDDSENK